MALSCYNYCRIFSQQSRLSLRHVFTNVHTTTRKQVSHSFSRKWNNTPDLKCSHSLHNNARGFRNKATQSNHVQPSGPTGDSFSYFKSTAFVTGVCSCSFLGAIIWNYENVRKVYKEMATEAENEKSNRQHRFMHEKMFGFRQHLNAIWAGLDSSTKLTLGIIAANTLVWVLWKVPRLQPGMLRYFSSSAAHPKVSMVLSSFSHINFFHLLVNMYVLMSFAPIFVRLFGSGQFSAFYISAGTMSAFTSIVCHRLLRRPLSVSVGASGAIMGLLGMTGVLYPHAQLQIAFISELIPHSFHAETGIKAVILFDLLGLFMGWRVLDHAGHLGGMICGLLYAKYGNRLIWGNRDSVVRVWHNIRGKP